MSLVTNWTTLIISQILDDKGKTEMCRTSPTDIKSVLLTAVPFTIAAFFSLWVGQKTMKSKRRPCFSGSMMLCAALFLFGFAFFEENNPALALAFLCFANAAFMALNSNLVSLANAYFYEDGRATGIAAFNTFFAIGMMVSPLFIGYLVQYKGYSITATVLAALTFCMGSSLFFLSDPSFDE